MSGPRKPGQPAQLYRFAPGERPPATVEPHDCVVALRALGEDTRVRIVGLLIESPLDVGGIAARLDVSPYNVSKHLRILREAGLLEVQKEGRRHLYALREIIRRRAAAGSVLDLGCCSFQFDPAEAKTPEITARRGRRPPSILRASRRESRR